MRYYSTKNRKLSTGLREAILRGLAPDRGLYMPARFPILSRDRLLAFREMDLSGIAMEISALLFGDDIASPELEGIVRDSITFDTPLVQVEEDIYSLELFHGPTLAFKDVGARFLARLLAYFTRDLKEEVHVLVATSGDTGSAVASGFYGVEGIRVHVLYPSGKVSPLQEKQFSTLGGNISAVEVEGTFDDCQDLVKEAFMDESLTAELTLTSANSINLARFLPQAFYYFRGWAQLPLAGGRTTGAGNNGGGRTAGAGNNGSEMPPDPCFFSVPSGNYGNMTAGLVAREMGLPVHTFLSANNINDVVPSYLLTGKLQPRPSEATIANAMDVGNPSNFDRILDLFQGKHEWITHHLHGYSYTDHQIRETIGKVWDQSRYLLDPHGAIGYRAAREYRDAHPGSTGIFLETAHPAKFRESVEEVTGRPVEIPERLAACLEKEKQSVPMKPDYATFKAYLLP